MSSSLRTIRETLRKITLTWNDDDWDKHKPDLERIRASTIPPRRKKAKARTTRSQSSTSQDFDCIDDILALPASGEETPEQIETAVETLSSEEGIVEHCEITKAPRHVRTMARDIFLSSARSIEFYENIWPGTKFYQSSGTVACRLLEAEVTITDEDGKNAARRRINALLFALHFNTLVKKLGTRPNREKLIKDALKKESHKTSNQIKHLLNRGRWFMMWVRKFGLGAILALGESTASIINMGDDLRQLFEVCEAMSGFRKRAQALFGPAKQAVEEAICLSEESSGSSVELNPTIRYVGFPGVVEIPSNDRVRSCTPDGVAQNASSHGLHATKRASDNCQLSAYSSGSVSVPSCQEGRISDTSTTQSNAAVHGVSSNSWAHSNYGRTPLDTLVEAAVVQSSVAGTTFPLGPTADLGLGPTPGPPYLPQMHTWRTDIPEKASASIGDASGFPNGYEGVHMSMGFPSTSLPCGIEWGDSDWRQYLEHDFMVDP